MNEQAVVATVDLTKSYRNVTVVDKLNLRIEEGEIFGFLVPNGAGKTTTVLMLLGLTEPTSGTARVCGHNPTREPLQVKRITGYLPEKVGFYEDLTARQNLAYTTRLNDLADEDASSVINEALNIVGLSDVADQKVGKFSRGMKQRLGIADVLVKHPRMVFLDEPTSGLDPDGANQILDTIAQMSKEHKITIVLSSHQLPMVQRICDRVGILVKGRLVAEGPIERLGREALGGGRFRIEVQVSQPSPNLDESIRRINGVVSVEKSGDFLFITCDQDLRPQIAKAIVDSNTLLVQMKIQDYGLEEIYMKYFREG
ncbi:ABC-2 type transport system ATP-binding protein [Candidatus Hakubella thermalkaliphila]|uniref:ABC-2 type transport system ATP-binding protein n=1 Tax=Candidatus Hakubella thermalkaliphila TaxID=2754717 RepID=A0A6V8NS97_9ACTN|nr:ABC-2 type transport system ATP-binding protein [Candidatus Hakubella thermalkaliphila]